jgi:hypothetical protein
MLFSKIATGQMVRNDSIGNDPAKERLCTLRAKSIQGTSKTVPFEIDSGYVARSRATHPDTTFIAIDGMSPSWSNAVLVKAPGGMNPSTLAPNLVLAFN